MKKSITQKYIDKCGEVVQLENEVKEWKLDYEMLAEQLNAQVITNQELEESLNKLYREGALFYFEQDYIVSVAQVQPYHNRTFLQDVDVALINSALYQRTPFLYIENGTIKTNEEQYKIYRRNLVI